jgi:ubiquinol-cytochrome c reductase cytochrome c1 subunit
MLRKTLQLFAVVITLTGGLSVSGTADSATPAKKPAATAPAQKAPAPQTAQEPVAQEPAAAPQAAEAGADSQSVSTEAKEPEKVVWPFNGMTGSLDKQSAQRGFQIYSQVCSACHSMNLVTYRSLGQLGFSEGEIKAIASQKQVEDENDNGERIQRPGKPFDHFVPPFPNEKASRAANNGAYPPDLSLIVKAREHGPDYVYSIITGFGTAPANETPVANKYYDAYFQGHWISMPPPLRDGAVTYQDGTNASVDQMARDVVTFLQWAAEPEMQQRHEMGIKVLIFLLVMTGFLYAAKKRIWKNLK